MLKKSLIFLYHKSFICLEFACKIFCKIVGKRATKYISKYLFTFNKHSFFEGFLPFFNLSPSLKKTNWDIETSNGLDFYHLAPLFSSNNTNHGILGLTIRMSAYIYGVAKDIKAKKAIDIGTYKGGSAILLSVALGKNGKVWTIDNFEKEKRLSKTNENHTLLNKFSKKNDLDIIQIVGDSQYVKLPKDLKRVDIVLIDGGHTYEIVKNDYERYCKYLRVGGSLFFDDCSFEGTFNEEGSPLYMKPLIKEIIKSKKFKFIKTVDRLGHFIKVK